MAVNTEKNAASDTRNGKFLKVSGYISRILPKSEQLPVTMIKATTSIMVRFCEPNLIGEANLNR
jgi:hypothetical protein